jgi:hypothetical protein
VLKLILKLIAVFALISACRNVPGAVPPPRQPTLTPRPAIATSTAQPTPATPSLPPAEATSTPQPQADDTETTPSKANADVQFVRADLRRDGSWTFNVTVAHPDTGWEDYADGWDVALPDGEVIKANTADPFTRLLLHPHETEQPFTRSQSGLIIPADVTTVTVRAHDLVDGWGGQGIVVDLTQASGPGFEVTR